MARKGRKKAQLQVLNEVKTQLLIQCRNWGMELGELDFQEMVLAEQKDIQTGLLSEKANLEYELRKVGSDKKEAALKLERINGYLKKLEALMHKREESIFKLLAKKLGLTNIRKEDVKRIYHLKQARRSALV